MQSILEVNHVTKRYANHVALDDVSLKVPTGSIFGLLGPNGAGKTSLIRIINQITGPDQGEVLFRGEKLQSKHVDHIGYLPEERGLYKKMAVGEQALYLAQLKGLRRAEAKQRLKYWFDKMEISGWWNKKIEELSKGMQQKVQFVVTVLHNPELLILDEPFSGFDPINAQVIRNEIMELRDKGATIIFSTHNMGSVEELCDDIALIHRSHKILDGSVKEIRQAYKSDTYKVQFRGSLQAFTHALWTGASVLDHSEEDGVMTAVVQLQRGNKPNDLLQAVMPVCEIVGLQEKVPSMNDIFIMKVKEEVSVGTQSHFTE